MIQDLEGTSATTSRKGMTKEFDEGAIQLITDTVQKTMYSQPIQSMLREYCSNAKDSITEKNIAKSILTGQKKVEDYYVKQEGALYKDSQFDPSYYSLEHLSDKDAVHIWYDENENGQDAGYCDLLMIEDYGVGISHKRLHGMTSIGYSSKRNTNSSYGAFGFGSKCALASGVDSFTIESFYNGKRYELEVFDYQTISKIPKFNATTGQPNNFDVIESKQLDENGEPLKYKIYYEPTNRKNGARIHIRIKKANRIKVRETVEHHLLFFTQTQLHWKYSSVAKQTNDFVNIDFLAKRLYESENLVVTNASNYATMSIGLVKERKKYNDVIVCYGAIKFEEMDMTPIRAPLTIKLPIRSVVNNPDGTETVIQEGVSVTNSRESIIYDDNTTSFIKKFLEEEAVSEAEALIEKELDEKDFVKWVHKCREIKKSYGFNDSVLGQISKVIDSKSLKLKYKNDNSIVFTSDIRLFSMMGLTAAVISKERNYNYNKRGYEIKIKREELEKASVGYDYKKVYYTDAKVNHRKDSFIFDYDKNASSFVLFKFNTDVLEARKKLLLESLEEKGEKALKDKEKAAVDLQLAQIKLTEKYVAAIKASASAVNYDTLVIPDNYRASAVDDEAAKTVEVEEETPKVKVNHAEIRKLNNTALVYVYDQHGTTNSENHKLIASTSLFEDCENEIIYDCNTPEAISVMSNLALSYKNFITGKEKGLTAVMPNTKDSNVGWSSSYKFVNTNLDKCDFPFLMKVAKDNFKHFKSNPNAKNATEFIKPITNTKDKKITMNAHIANIITAAEIKDWVISNSYLEHFENINAEVKAKYKQLTDFVWKYNVRSIDTNVFVDSVKPLIEYNKALIANPALDETGKKNLIEKHFKDTQFSSTTHEYQITILNEEIMKIFSELREYSEPIRVLVSAIGFTKKHNGKGLSVPMTFTDEVIEAIKEYISLKM